MRRQVSTVCVDLAGLQCGCCSAAMRVERSLRVVPLRVSTKPSMLLESCRHQRDGQPCMDGLHVISLPAPTCPRERAAAPPPPPPG